MEEISKERTLIHLKREFESRVEPLFDAFLSAEEFKKWFSPPGLDPGNFSLDPVVDGEYSCEFYRQNEYFLTIKGKYLAIERYSKISFSLMYSPDISDIGECRVTVSFHEKGDTSEIVLNQEIYKTINAEGRTKGWEFMFSRLNEILNQKINS